MTRLLLALLLLTAVPARAQEVLASGTLKAILARGSILVGVRDSAAPFAFRNRGGQAIGFSVDICHAIAQQAAATLNRDLVEPNEPDWTPGIKLVFVPVLPDERLAKVTSGAVDLECSSTTATAERAMQVAFSPVFFLAGTKLMVARDAGLSSYRDLAGKTIAVSAGTTNAAVLSKLSTSPPFAVSEVASLDAVYDQLASGKAQAAASDDVLLAGLMATKPDGQRFRIVGDYLSFEPYAIMFRRDDPQFAAIVAQTFADLAASGRLSGLYNRWFINRLPNGTTLGLPMSAQLTEMYRTLGQTD